MRFQKERERKDSVTKDKAQDSKHISYKSKSKPCLQPQKKIANPNYAKKKKNSPSHKNITHFPHQTSPQIHIKCQVRLATIEICAPYPLMLQPQFILPKAPITPSSCPPMPACCCLSISTPAPPPCI